MCHNLGADQTLDPKVPVQGILGKYWVYGQKLSVTDGGNVSVTNGNTAWARTAAYPVKAPNDPCPEGYHVPTKAEWAGVIANNVFGKTGTWTSSTTQTVLTAMAKFGEQLYLPVAGYMVSGGNLGYVNTSSNYIAADGVANNTIPTLNFGNSSAPNTGGGGSGGQFSVRCIEQ
jgi:uncharacterized protein (TIGR02145 family)